MYQPRPPPPPYRQPTRSTLDLHSWLSSVTTLNTLGTMSPKGYSAVPTDDPRESIDTDSRIAPTDALDDEPQSSASDRLLPSTAQDDHDPLPLPHREPWNKRAVRWIRSRPARVHASLKAFRKRTSLRSVLLVILIGLLIASTTGLAISTGILATRPRYCGGCYSNKESRIPWIWKTNAYRPSWMNNVDLPALYPPVADDAESSCKYAWGMTNRIECHEKILNRAWDDGKQASLFEPRYDLYADKIGSSSCLMDLESVYQILSSQCTNKDEFDTTTYVGPMIADPHLESGPVAAVKTLLDRARHSRRTPPLDTMERYRPHRTCAAELYQDWFVIDGMNSGNLHGLDVFLKATATRNTNTNEDPDDYYWHSYQVPADQCDGIYAAPYTSRGYDNPDFPKKGPNDGDTRCSWCVMNWFDRKLQSWEEGRVIDPVNGTHVGLQEYLRAIEHAGRRCQPSDWGRIWRKNVEMYKERGLLPGDWEGEKGVYVASTYNEDRRLGLGRANPAPYGRGWTEQSVYDDELFYDQTWD